MRQLANRFRGVRASTQREGLALLFFLSIYLLTVRGYYGGDHFLSYMTAESLALDRSLALSQRLSDVSEIREQQQRRLVQPVLGHDGRPYSHYGIGLPLAMAPFYLLGHTVSCAVPGLPHDLVTMFAVSCTNAVITALTCITLAACARRLSYSARTAFGLAVLYGFGTMAWNYAQYSYAEPLLVLLSVSALYYLCRYRQFANKSWRSAAASGIWAGLCLLTEVYSAAIIAICFGVCVLWIAIERLSKDRCALLAPIAYGAATIPSVAFLIYFNLLRFGRALPTDQRLVGDFSLAYIPVALYGFTLSTGKSLFLYCPALLVALGGIRSFSSRHTHLAILIVAIAALSVIPIATWINWWHGDLAWGPRFLFHLVPLLLLPATEILEHRIWRRWPKLFMIAVLALALIVQPASILVNQGHYIAVVEDHGLGDTFFTPYLSPIVGHGLLIISTVGHWFTGHSLHISYPGPAYRGLEGGVTVDFGPYEGFDLWFVNLAQRNPGPSVVYIAVIGVLTLLAVATGSSYSIWRSLGNRLVHPSDRADDTEERRCASPGG
ncbi:MAG: phospholipid carrier-dependent glycosyltransferase [Chloroflexi bacterium]|nr:phospholipid carrier-dependent glycosyltransferase [Chloroflexota bacterium]